jgi:hypothetical protein
MTEPCVIDGPMNGNGFVASVEQVLVPIHRLLLIGSPSATNAS